MAIEKKSESRCFGGTLSVYAHASRCTGTEMKFSVFLPPAAASTPCPAVTFLAGLECTQDTFVQKSGAPRLAAELGLILIAPDTSPRGAGIPGEDDSWDFGTSASFYLDATAEPWSRNYRMGGYINDELREIVFAELPVKRDRMGIMGHSMGGHGALVSSLRNPGLWQSVSALAPIANPCAVPWGEKAFGHYLGPDRESWKQWDATELLRAGKIFPGHVLVDQGTADKFLAPQLHPEALEAAARAAGQEVKVRMQEGYDHSYWFIQTFVADHLTHHAKALT